MPSVLIDSSSFYRLGSTEHDFMSFIGGVAYALFTQPWVAVYLVALQRGMQKATNLEVRRLNALLRFLQQNPKDREYPPMRCEKLVEAHTDSAFTREDTTGYENSGSGIQNSDSDSAFQQSEWDIIISGGNILYVICI